MSKSIIITAIAALAIGAAAGYFLAPVDRGQSQTASPSEVEPEVLFWRNPMNPAITSPVFTQDEMGMDYLPVYAPREVPLGDADGGSGGSEPVGTVTIDPVVVQNIGVRTAVVEQRPLARQINALGHVDFNEERLARLHPKTSGWIEHLQIEETGTKVRQGSILLSIYSPDLVAAQQEYVVAMSNVERLKNKASSSVLQSARERLQLFDVPAHQIKELEKSRKPMRSLHIHSPFKGRVMNIGVREGQYVTPNDELYMIADLGRIWVYVDVYEDDQPWLKIGDKAEMRVRAAPGKKFVGEVSFIHPTQDPKTRTVRVRLAFDNPDLLLKPGMFANVVLQVDPRPEALVVPSEAIVRSGDREQLFVAKGNGKFEPRDVVLGISAAGYSQVLEGVAFGERVVTSSQFLIDSESKLREATAKMMAGESADSLEHSMSEMDMGGMDMSDMEMEEMSMEEMSMDDVPGATEMDVHDMHMQE